MSVIAGFGGYQASITEGRYAWAGEWGSVRIAIKHFCSNDMCGAMMRVVSTVVPGDGFGYREI